MIIDALRLTSDPTEFVEVLDGLTLLKPDQEEDEAEKEEMLFASPVSVRVDASYVAGILMLEGKISYWTEGECARCLTPVRKEIYSSFETQIDLEKGRLYAPDLELEEEEQEGSFSLLAQHTVNIRGEIANRVLQSVPLRLLCKEDCPGIPYELEGEKTVKADQTKAEEEETQRPFAQLADLLVERDKKKKKG